LFSEKKQMLKIKDLQDGKDFDANMPWRGGPGDAD
jgi:hypothetical protein